MNTKEFLVESLNSIVTSLPTTKVRYQNHKPTRTHLVEVTPRSILNNEAFLALEEQVTFEFIRRFPRENIYFVSDTSYPAIERLDYEVSGPDFKSPPVRYSQDASGRSIARESDAAYEAGTDE